MILKQCFSYLALALLAFPMTASASVKCNSPELFADFDSEIVTQLIKAEGVTNVPRGALYAAEQNPAYLQIRALSASSVRDYQVRTAEAYRKEDVQQVLLTRPQIVKISGGGLMRPLLIALPESINFSLKGNVGLETRAEAGDPSRDAKFGSRDIAISSLATDGSSSLVFEQQVIRRRGEASLRAVGNNGITSWSTRTVEMKGEHRDGRFFVTALAITVREPNALTPLTQITVSLPQPLVLNVH